MNSGPPPNYYAILEVSDSASATQIRDAYKRAALKTHPDRVPSDSPERGERTRKFQMVNDAYYTLSDPTRRRDYDAQRKLYGQSGRGNSMPGGATWADADPFADTEMPQAGTSSAGARAAAGASAASWAWNFFTGGGAKADANSQQRQREEAERAQFGDVFEEMLREEGVEEQPGQPTSSVWSVLGTMSGMTLGYIVANFPGAIAGGAAGNSLGRVRDKNKKSVYDVFKELPDDTRMRVLSQLATKVFSHAVGI